MRCVLLMGLLLLSSCAQDRDDIYTIKHEYWSPRARQLPPGEVEHIFRLVSSVPATNSVTSDQLFIGIGQTGRERTLDEMNVVTENSPDEVTVFHLRKKDGKWRIVGRELAPYRSSKYWYAR
jgi:hypothetical protein